MHIWKTTASSETGLSWSAAALQVPSLQLPGPYNQKRTGCIAVAFQAIQCVVLGYSIEAGVRTEATHKHTHNATLVNGPCSELWVVSKWQP